MKTLTLIEAAAALGAVAVQKMGEESGELSPAARDAAEKLAAVKEPDADPAEAWTEDPAGNPLLIESVMTGREIRVSLPDGTVAFFRVDRADGGTGLPVLVHIYPAASRFANVFRYSPEGAHPFLCRAARMEKGGEA